MGEIRADGRVSLVSGVEVEAGLVVSGVLL